MNGRPWGKQYEPFDNFHQAAEDDLECLRQGMAILGLAMETYRPEEIAGWTLLVRACLLRLNRRLFQVEAICEAAENAMVEGQLDSGTPPTPFNYVHHTSFIEKQRQRRRQEIAGGRN